MSLLTRMLVQAAVYWPPSSDKFDEYGVPIISTPEAIDVRWEETAEEFIDAKGTKQTSQVVVYVGQDVGVGGVLMLGTLAEVDPDLDPKEHPQAYEIRSFAKIPNLRATKWLRKAFL